MQRAYHYKNLVIEVTVEGDIQLPVTRRTASTRGFVAVVRVVSKGAGVPLFAPFRLGDPAGQAFATEAEALMGGYSAGQRLVDDLIGREG
jgi:hypothetical protein